MKKKSSWKLLTDRFKIGEFFVELTVDKARKRLEQSIDAFEQEIQKDDEELSRLTGQMQELKAVLYGKFKGSINLEYDD